jgi:hypothetical protein
MLTKDSKSIINFIKKNFKISKNGFKELKLLYNHLNNVKNNYNIIKTKINDNNNHVNFQNPYISDKIRESIRSLKNNYNITIKINNNTTNINIYYNDENIQEFVMNIINIISYVNNLLNKEIGSMNINYYLTDFKKMLDNDIINGLNHHHINNGCCSPMTNTIDIWRKEEIMKVTIHELMHLFNCDKSMNDNSNIIDLYKQRYNINSVRVNTFEGYTEIWANILNSFLLSNDYSDFVNNIYLEKEWCKFQASKIFYITNLNKGNIIDINKHTNVLAYFIIRCELYNNLKEFIKIFGKDICCNTHNYFKFLKNINKCERNDKLIKKIRKNYIYKSLRMSAVEYKLI